MKMTKTAKKSTKPMAAPKTAKTPKPAMSMPMRGARTAKNMKTKEMR